MNDLIIDNQVFKPGQSGIVKINVGILPSNTRISVQAHIFRAKKPGVTTLLLAGIHGDEINSIEIIRRLLKAKRLEKLKTGTVIVIPLLNIYGFINFNRYVPDGKDVNRSFPGTLNGSLASRIARTLTKYIFPHVDYILDFHTGGDMRYNHPQIRYTKSDQEARKLAEIFNPPFIIESGLIPKSLRKTAKVQNIPTIVYEGGESIRLNDEIIKSGIGGLMNTLKHLDHISLSKTYRKNYTPIIIRKTSWIRASYSGIFIWEKKSGAKVRKGEQLGTINDPYGNKSKSVIAKKTGYIIGHNNASVVNQGDALFHIGFVNDSKN